MVDANRALQESRSTRARGLKRKDSWREAGNFGVAPHVDAWIETRTTAA